MTDRYTKCILTVIAVTLIVSVVQNSLPKADAAIPQGCGGAPSEDCYVVASPNRPVYVQSNPNSGIYVATIPTQPLEVKVSP
jgi:hypothetical protein